MMYKKKIFSLLMSIMLLLHALPLLSVEATPRWVTTSTISARHHYDNEKACCSIEIRAHPQITKIDNIEIKLYKISGTNEVLVKRWPTMSIDNYKFEFYDEVDNVQTGYTYRLSVTADVHGLGVIEEVSKSSEVTY